MWKHEFNRNTPLLKRNIVAIAIVFPGLLNNSKRLDEEKNQSTKIGKPKRLARKVVLFLI
jgi:hypothetical protein